MTFKEDGYFVCKDFIDTKKLYKVVVKYSDENPGIFDIQSPNSPAYYGKPSELMKLHFGLLPKLEQLTGYKLFKTYFYWRMYYNGAILKQHTDRPACEISGTLFLGGDPWDLLLIDKHGKEIRIKQKPGDILLYKGCELVHYREQFIIGDNHAQIFLHYVDQNGPNAWCKDDVIKNGATIW